MDGQAVVSPGGDYGGGTAHHPTMALGGLRGVPGPPGRSHRSQRGAPGRPHAGAALCDGPGGIGARGDGPRDRADARAGGRVDSRRSDGLQHLQGGESLGRRGPARSKPAGQRGGVFNPCGRNGRPEGWFRPIVGARVRLGQAGRDRQEGREALVPERHHSPDAPARRLAGGARPDGADAGRRHSVLCPGTLPGPRFRGDLRVHRCGSTAGLRGRMFCRGPRSGVWP